MNFSAREKGTKNACMIGGITQSFLSPIFTHNRQDTPTATQAFGGFASVESAFVGGR